MHNYIKQSNKLIWRRSLGEDCVNEVTALWDEFIMIHRGNTGGGLSLLTQGSAAAAVPRGIPEPNATPEPALQTPQSGRVSGRTQPPVPPCPISIH